MSKKKLDNLLARMEHIERHLRNDSSFMVIDDGRIIRQANAGFYTFSCVGSEGEIGEPVQNIDILESIVRDKKVNMKKFTKQHIIELNDGKEK